MLSKSQLDKIGERLRQGDIDGDALRWLESYAAQFSVAYKAVERMLRDVLGHDVTGRPIKSTISIIDKLKRQKIRLTQIQDIAGCRVVVTNTAAQDSLVEAALVMFGDVVVDDKRNSPQHGYRAVHLIVRQDGMLVEVQVRTRLQHFWAEMSEKIADTFGHEIKYGSGDREALTFLDRLSKQIQKIEVLHGRRLGLTAATPGLARGKFKSLKKQAGELDRAIRLEFYKLRELTTFESR